MKCKKCANEFQGNFCPYCGTRAIATEHNTDTKITEQEEITHSKCTKEKEPTKHNNLKKLPKIITLIPDIIVSVLLFHYKCNILMVIALWIVEILIIILEKAKLKKFQSIMTIIGVLIVFLAVYNIYNGYQNEKYIRTVQTQQYQDISYQVLFDNFSNDLQWECVEKGRFTTIDPNEPDRSGGYEAVVTVSSRCYVGNEESNYTLTFNVSEETHRAVPKELQFYGSTYYSSNDINHFLDSVYRYDMGYSDFEQEPVNNTLDNNVDNVMEDRYESVSSEDDTLWFLNYDSFYHTNTGDQLSVYTMNDALIFVSFSGINGDSMEWELHLKPDEIGADGRLIYYYGKDFSLNYYPDDHHIYINTSNDLYSGEYWLNP